MDKIEWLPILVPDDNGESVRWVVIRVIGEDNSSDWSFDDRTQLWGHFPTSSSANSLL